MPFLILAFPRLIFVISELTVGKLQRNMTLSPLLLATGIWQTRAGKRGWISSDSSASDAKSYAQND